MPPLPKGEAASKSKPARVSFFLLPNPLFCAIPFLYSCLYLWSREEFENGTGTYLRTAGHRVVFAHRGGRGRHQDRCAEAGRAADPLEPAGLSGRSGHDRPLLHDGLQRGDPAQPAGRVRTERSGHPHRHRADAGPNCPAERPPGPHLPVRIGLLQRSLYGLPAHFGAVWVGGAALCQRLCDRVQYPALDHGLRHGQRQFQPEGSGPQPAAHPGAVCDGGGPRRLPAADPGARPHRPAAGTAEQHEHPAFHAHHRHPHRHGRPEADRLRPTHLETGRAADAGHPGGVSGGLCGAGSAALRHERTGGAAVGVLPCRCNHLGVRRSVRPR